MTSYQNGKIYKIEDVGGNLCYIGSTTKQYLSQRMTWHRGDYTKWLAGQHRKITAFNIFEQYGIENCKIVLIELYPCDSKDELRKREAHFITTLDCVNKCIPGRTPAEYYQDNKEHLKREAREDYARKKEHNEYYTRMLDAKKIYAEKNKEHIKTRRSEVVACECGKSHTRAQKSYHMKSNTHKTALEIINNL